MREDREAKCRNSTRCYACSTDACSIDHPKKVDVERSETLKGTTARVGIKSESHRAEKRGLSWPRRRSAITRKPVAGPSSPSQGSTRVLTGKCRTRFSQWIQPVKARIARGRVLLPRAAVKPHRGLNLTRSAAVHDICGTAAFNMATPQNISIILRARARTCMYICMYICMRRITYKSTCRHKCARIKDKSCNKDATDSRTDMRTDGGTVG